MEAARQYWIPAFAGMTSRMAVLFLLKANSLLEEVVGQAQCRYFDTILLV